jgi:hypothetical protein
MTGPPQRVLDVIGEDEPAASSPLTGRYCVQADLHRIELIEAHPGLDTTGIVPYNVASRKT